MLLLDGADGSPRPRPDVDAADLVGTGIDDLKGRVVGTVLAGRGNALVGRGIRDGGSIDEPLVAAVSSCSMICVVSVPTDPETDGAVSEDPVFIASGEADLARAASEEGSFAITSPPVIASSSKTSD